MIPKQGTSATLLPMPPTSLRSSLVEKYRAQVDEMLVERKMGKDTPCGVIFIDEDRLAELDRARVPVVLLSAEDRTAVRGTWTGPDPHGWGPSLERMIAVILPLV